MSEHNDLQLSDEELQGLDALVRDAYWAGTRRVAVGKVAAAQLAKVQPLLDDLRLQVAENDRDHQHFMEALEVSLNYDHAEELASRDAEIERLERSCLNIKRILGETGKAAVSELAAQQQRMANLAAALAQCNSALHLTREYVGVGLLPAIPGWSWFDAVVASDSALAAYAGDAEAT